MSLKCTVHPQKTQPKVVGALCNVPNSPTWCGVNRRRMARVFFGRKSKGLYF
jgi:hypothetical protein